MANEPIASLNVETYIRCGEELVRAQEELITACIQPKPRWLPKWIWEPLLKRILVVEMRRKVL